MAANESRPVALATTTHAPGAEREHAQAESQGGK